MTSYTIVLEKQLLLARMAASGEPVSFDGAGAVPPAEHAQRRDVSDALPLVMARATPVYVRPEVTALLEASIASWLDPPFQRELPPTDCGFAYFDGTTLLRVDPLDGSAMELLGVAWSFDHA
jgi:hypothetical protein